VLLDARAARSQLHLATANLNADLCAVRSIRATPRHSRRGENRSLFDGKPLVPGVKAVLAHIHGDTAWPGDAAAVGFAAADRTARWRAMTRHEQGRVPEFLPSPLRGGSTRGSAAGWG